MQSGDLVSQRYQIVKPLGEGGMAAVYLAYDSKKEKRPVALKLIHQDLATDQALLQRFNREVFVMKKIKHPNVAAIYDWGEHEQAAFFVMEYVHGCSLERFLSEGNRLNSTEIVMLLLGICDGLSAIHRQGIIHRDIKPSNIMVSTAGVVKIIDLGAAYEGASTLTAPHQRIGSLFYLAPEVWRGGALSPSADLYSLGVVLYELATGKVPFEGKSPASIMRMHTEEEPAAPNTLNKQVPDWLNNLTLSLLAKKPAARPASAEAVIQYATEHAVKEFQSLTSGGLAGHPITAFARVIERESLHQPKVIDRDNEPDQKRKRTYIFQLKATQSYIAPQSQAARRRATVVIPLPGRAAMIFEIEKPSKDFLFLGLFLVSLQIFDGVLTSMGINRWSSDFEGNPLLRYLMEHYGPDLTLLVVKGFAVAAVLMLTIVARRAPFVKNSLSVLCVIYLCAAVLPWTYLLLKA